MTLSENSTMQLLKEFNSLGIIDLLSYLAEEYALEDKSDDLKASNPDSPHPIETTHTDLIRIVGSYVFWVAGKDYADQVYKKFGINREDFFTDQMFEAFFQRPADIDIRVYFFGHTLEELKPIAKIITAFIKAKNPKAVTTRKPFSNGVNCTYTVTVELYGKKYDIILVGKLHKEFLFGDDDQYISLPINALEKCKSSNASVSKLPVLHLKGTMFKGWHAFFLKMMRVKWTDRINSVNVQGAIKYLLSTIHDFTCLTEEFETGLFKKFLTILGEKPEMALEGLHRAIQNNMPGHSSAFTAFCFNIHFLFNIYKPENWESLSRLLFQEPKKQTKKDLLPPPKKPEIIALQELMKDSKAPFEVISSFLLIHGLLLESRGRYLPKSEALALSEAQTGGRSITHLKFLKEGITLTLPIDPLKAAEALQNHFVGKNLSKETLRSFKKLSEPFFNTLTQNYALSPDHPPLDLNLEACADIQKIAFSFLECEPLKVMGFLLLCHFGQAKKSSEYFLTLIQMLPDLLVSSANSNFRTTLFLAFYHYYCSCKPFDSALIEESKIQKFVKEVLAMSASSEVDILFNFCSLFSRSEDVDVRQSISLAWEKLPGKSRNYMQYGKEIIKGYLTNKNGILGALTILQKMAQNKQTAYADLAGIYCSISEKIPSASPAELLLFQKVCLAILLKDSSKTARKLPILQLSEYLIAHSMVAEAIELLDKGEEKQLKSPETSAKRLAISELLFSDGKYSEACRQWEKAFSSQSEAAIQTLLKWRANFKRQGNLQSLKLEQRLEFFKILLLACDPKTPTHLACVVLEATIEEIRALNNQERGLSKEDIHLFLTTKGKWLFEQIKNLEADHAALHEKLRTYQEAFQRAELDGFSASLLNHVGAQSILQIALSLKDQAGEEMAKLSMALLDDSFIDMQMAGLQLACQDEAFLNLPDSFSRLCSKLIAMLNQSLPPSQNLHLLDSFMKAFPIFRSAAYEELTVILKSEKTNEEQIVAICACLSKVPHPDIDKILFDFWWQNQSLALGLKLFSLFFDKNPEFARQIKESLDRASSLPSKHLEEAVSTMIKPIEPNDSHGLASQIEMVHFLLQKHKGKIENPLKSQVLSIVVSALKNDFEKGLHLFEVAQSKQLFDGIPDFLYSTAIKIAKRLHAAKRDAEAYAYWRQASKITIDEKAIELLCLWETIHSTPELLELVLTALEMNPHEKLADRVISNLSKISDNSKLQQIFIQQLPHIIISLKGLPKSSLHTLLHHLTEQSLDALQICEEHNLYDTLIEDLEDADLKLRMIHWASKNLSANQHFKLASRQASGSKFYFLLAALSQFELSIRLTCIHRALASTLTEKKVEYFETSLKCLNDLIEASREREATSLLRKIETCFGNMDRSKELAFWQLIIQQHTAKNSLELISIFVRLAPEFEMHGLKFQLAPSAASFCMHLFNSQKCMKEAVEIAFLYNLNAAFWIEALPLLPPHQQTTLGLLDKLTSSWDLLQGTEEETYNWHRIYFKCCLQQHKGLFLHFLPHVDLLVNKLTPLREPWKGSPLYFLLLGLISLLPKHQQASRELLETGIDKLEKQLTLSMDCLHLPEFQHDFISNLLKTETEMGLELATKHLVEFSIDQDNSISEECFIAFLSRALKLFCSLELYSEDRAGKNLQCIIFKKKFLEDNHIVEKLEPYLLLDFASRLQDLNCLATFYDFSLKQLNHLSAEFFAGQPQYQKERLICSYDRLIQAFNHSSYFTLTQTILEHPNLSFLYGPQELSEQWAIYFLRVLEKLDFEGIMTCIMNANHLSHFGPQERKFLDKLAESLLSTIWQTNCIDYYFGSLVSLLRKFACYESSSFIENWNMQNPAIEASFNTFLEMIEGQPIIESLKVKVKANLMELTANSVLIPNYEEVVEEITPTRANFFTPFVEILLKKITSIKSNYIDIQCFALANIFFLQNQLIAMPTFEGTKNYSLIYLASFRYIPINCDLFRLHCEMIGSLLLSAANSIASSFTAPKLYQLSLFLTLEPQQKYFLHAKHRSQALEELITMLCKNECAHHAHRAIEILHACQKVLLIDSPNRFKACYMELLKFAKISPFLILEDEDTIPNGTGMSSPLIYCIGNLLIKACSTEKNTASLATSLKYQAVIAELFCNYFQLAEECILEMEQDEQNSLNTVLSTILKANFLQVTTTLPTAEEQETINHFKQNGYTYLTGQYLKICALPFMNKFEDKLLKILDCMASLAVGNLENRSSFFILIKNLWENSAKNAAQRGLFKQLLNKWHSLLTQNNHKTEAQVVSLSNIYQDVNRR